MAGELHPVPAIVAGLLIAGGVHAAKTLARPVVTVFTGGMGNWLISLLEDLLSLIIAILAILVPVLRVFHHVGDSFAEDRVAESVNGVVTG